MVILRSLRLRAICTGPNVRWKIQGKYHSHPDPDWTSSINYFPVIYHPATTVGAIWNGSCLSRPQTSLFKLSDRMWYRSAKCGWLLHWRYNDLMAPMIRAIQELSNQLEEQKKISTSTNKDRALLGFWIRKNHPSTIHQKVRCPKFLDYFLLSKCNICIAAGILALKPCYVPIQK